MSCKMDIVPLRERLMPSRSKYSVGGVECDVIESISEAISAVVETILESIVRAIRMFLGLVVEFA